ncbi:hypothetical protein [Sphingomonas sp. NIC1]
MTGVPYRGINVLTLWVAAMTRAMPPRTG